MRLLLGRYLALRFLRALFPWHKGPYGIMNYGDNGCIHFVWNMERRMSRQDYYCPRPWRLLLYESATSQEDNVNGCLLQRYKEWYYYIGALSVRVWPKNDNKKKCTLQKYYGQCSTYTCEDWTEEERRGVKREKRDILYERAILILSKVCTPGIINHQAQAGRWNAPISWEEKKGYPNYTATGFWPRRTRCTVALHWF